MDNPEEVLHSLDEFAKLKPKNIPRELEDYLMYVARTGDPVYQWPTVKTLFREKLLHVITEFYESTPTLDVNPSPNVDPFNYETMKAVLLERLEAFPNAPFTVQRLCELLTTPRKEYNRPDKFMRAIEKNILVVSTREPGTACRPDSALSEPMPNGVTESPESVNSQPTASPAVPTNDGSTVQISSSDLSKEAEKKIENSAVPELSSALEVANHVVTEQIEVNSKASEEVEEDKHDESSTEVPKIDCSEQLDVSDASEHVSREESSVEVPGTTNITVTDSQPNAEVADVPEHPQLKCEAETNDAESNATVACSDVTNVKNDVSELIQDNCLTEQEKEAEVAPSKIEPERKEAEIPPAEISKDGVEADTEVSEKSGESSKLIEEAENAPSSEGPLCIEAAASTVEAEQPSNSTTSAILEDKDTADTALSFPPDVTPSERNLEPKLDNIDSTASISPERLKVAPTVKEVDSEVKETVEAVQEVTVASISSSENSKVKGEDSEAMDVDEGSNQASAAESDAMEVGEDEEPMEVCEDGAVEEMTSSPQEHPQ